jgi:hypothetical protein
MTAVPRVPRSPSRGEHASAFRARGEGPSIDEAAAPSTEPETLFDFSARLITGDASIERGDHVVF